MVRKLTHEEAVQKLIDNDIKFKLLSPYTKRTDIHTFLCYCGKEFESSYDTIITGGILSCGCHKNYIGKKFHYLTVIEKTNKKRYDRPLYKCVCECGKEVFTTIHMMSQGDMVSCGCKRMMDHTNKRFGSLVAIKHIDSPNGQPRWLCKCDCGREKIIKGYSLSTGNIKSCGVCKLYINGVRASRPQLELKKLLNRGIINFKTKSGYYPDISFVYNGQKIAVEYDDIKWHSDKKIEKEKLRTKILLNNKWKIIRIIVDQYWPDQEMVDKIHKAINNKNQLIEIRL